MVYGGTNRQNTKRKRKEKISREVYQKRDLVISYGVDIETILEPRLQLIGDILYPGSNVLRYLKERYKSDEAYYAISRDALDDQTMEAKDNNKCTMLKIVRDILHAEAGLRNHVEAGTQGLDDPKPEFDYSKFDILDDGIIIFDVVDDGTIEEEKLRHCEYLPPICDSCSIHLIR